MREVLAARGPRVSLYDASLERVLAVKSKREMPVDDTGPIAAEVGPDAPCTWCGSSAPGPPSRFATGAFPAPPTQATVWPRPGQV